LAHARTQTHTKGHTRNLMNNKYDFSMFYLHRLTLVTFEIRLIVNRR